MNGNNSNKRTGLAADIRRQVGTEATKRFLRTLPAFRLDKEVPKHFRELLERLEGAEATPDNGGRRQ